MEATGDVVIENMFFNGWNCDHYVTNVFVFAPNGTIVIAGINAPGCQHDSTFMGFLDLYSKVEALYNNFGAKTAVDSAFCKVNQPYLIKSSNVVHNTPLEMAVNEQATSMRQTSEWGMNGFQRSFPRMQDRYRYEENGDRKLSLMLIILLYNLRSRRVGLNQLLAVYMPNLSPEGTSLFHDH
jgi:hypothetical protein